MHPLIARLVSEAPVLSDGAWGTRLQARGLAPGECPDAWNLTRPAEVEAVAAAYVAAGSRVILSNTFGANRLVLSGHGLADRAAEVARSGAAISCRAAAGKALVFASLGPSGKLPSAGEIGEAELAAVFAEQARALAEGGADAVVVETMSDPVEAALAVRAVKAAGLPAVASFAFTSGKALDRTICGTTPEAAARAAQEAGADAVGANCGLGPAQMLPLCPRLAAAGLPLWMKPNAGLPRQEGGRTVFPAGPAEFALGLRALVAAGAAFVGGCCGSTPEHITAF